MSSDPAAESREPNQVGRADLLASIGIAVGLQFAFLTAMDLSAVKRLRVLIGQFRAPGADLWLPTGAFVWAALKILLFYLLLGVFLGAASYVVARVLTSNKDESGEWVSSRRRYYPACLALLALVVGYMHFHAMLLYPALFDSSWRWAALAGSPTVVMLVGLAGKIGGVILLLVVLNKRRQEIVSWLRSRALVVVSAVVAISAVFGLAGLAQRPGSGNQGPNVILIGLDSIRPDHVSGLGYAKRTGRRTTPNLDAFIKDGVLFADAHVPLARTGPSWVSVLTACFPTKNGHRCDLAPKESRIPPVKAVGTHLQELGYKTSFFLDNSNFMSMDPELGFDHIFQPDPNIVWFSLSHFPIHLLIYYYCLNNSLGFNYAPMLRANQAFTAIYQHSHFAEIVRRHLAKMKGEKKFFLAAHTCIVHAPFGVRYPYSTYFAPPKNQPTPTNRFTFRWPIEKMMSEEEFLRRRNRAMQGPVFSQEINLYDALVRQTDDWFGMVIQGIRDLDLYDNSLIVVFSDHGEDLFPVDPRGYPYEYLTSNHGFHVWGDGGYHVFLAMKFPKGKYAGRTVPWLVRSIDIAPTVLEALGLNPLPGAEGVSLMPQVEDPSLDPRLSTYAEPGLTLDAWFVRGHRKYPFEHWVLFQYVDRETLRMYRKQEYMAGFVMAKDRALRDSRWKIIAYPMQGDPIAYMTTLHDVQADPTNRTDWSTSEPQVLAEMRRRLAPYIQSDAAQYGFEWLWSDKRIADEEVSSATLSLSP